MIWNCVEDGIRYIWRELSLNDFAPFHWSEYCQCKSTRQAHGMRPLRRGSAASLTTGTDTLGSALERLRWLMSRSRRGRRVDKLNSQPVVNRLNSLSD